MTTFKSTYRSDISQNGPETVEKVWPCYLDGGYFNPDGSLKIKYVSREQVEFLVRTMCQVENGLTSHQIRRYFGHCRAIEIRMKSGGASWAEVLPEIKKLDIAADDGFAKRPRKIPPLFRDFIKRNVATIKAEKDFLKGFLPHFEAIVGFGRIYFKKGGN